jgi:hypothetical protein
MRCGCDYEETITLSGKEDKSDTAEFFDFKAFRYIEVFNFPGKLTKKSIFVNHRHYPIPKNHAINKTDNALFQKIWEMCEKGIIEGTQESYIDCPTREKGAFLGDGLITGLSHLSYTNDARIMKKFLYDCMNSARLCPGLFCTTVTYDASQMIDYSLVFPIVLNKYFEYTNDKKTFRFTKIWKASYLTTLSFTNLKDTGTDKACAQRPVHSISRLASHLQRRIY